MLIELKTPTGGVRGEIEECLLQKHEGSIDNDVERTSWVEYCLVNCDGAAHRTGEPQGDGCFCPKHVRRNVNMYLKKNVLADGLAAWIG